MENEESIRKNLKLAKALSIFEGVCFFVAGICAVMAEGLLGFISGGLLIALACANMVPAFFGGDSYYLNIGHSLVEDEDMDEYGARLEEAKDNENAGV